MGVSDKVMFEIYREAGYGRKYRVVYFTELDEHHKESEIARAMAGEHLFDGFIAESKITSAKPAIEDLLGRLNGGEAADAGDVAKALAPFLVS